MQRILLIGLVVGASWICTAQTVVSEFPITLTRSLSDHRDVLPFVAEDQKSIALLLVDNQSATGVLLDSNFSILSRNEWNCPPLGSFEIIGGFQNGQDYFVAYSNKSRAKMTLHSLSFEKGFTSADFELPGKEKFVGSFSLDSKWYVVSIIKRTSILKFYQFSNEKDFKEIVFDFSDYKFDPTWPLLHYAITGKTLNDININVIDYDFPKSLNQTSCNSKLYFFGEKAIMTIEKPGKTFLLEMDLKSASKRVVEFRTPCDFVAGNTFLYYDKLAQVSFCDDHFSLRILNTKTKVALQDFGFGGDDEIYFKNSPIVQEGGGTLYSQDREMVITKTKQFLRKISNGSLAVEIHPLDNGHLAITMGAVKDITQPAGGAFAPGFAGSGQYGSNYVPSYGYNTYSWSRTTYFSSMVDAKTFDHVNRQVEPGAIDSMKKFDEKEQCKVKTNFRIADKYFFGYYDPNKKQYRILRFAN